MVATRDEVRTEYKVIGTRPIRPDGLEKVTGRALYGADVNLPGALYGKVLRSPHAHARIRGIDTAKAEALPGVKAVVTGVDFPETPDRMIAYGEAPISIRDVCQNILAGEKALYRGHAVAAVAATSPRVAEEALRLIAVDYEPLPPVLEVRAAMAEDAPLLDEVRRTSSGGQLGDKPSN